MNISTEIEYCLNILYQDFIINILCLSGITRGILVSNNIPVPDGVVMTAEDPAEKYPGPFPAVVKPTKMENSVGVEIVEDYDQMQGALERAWQYGDTAVVDQFIAGREVRCGSVELVPGVVSPLGCIEYKVSCSQQ